MFGRTATESASTVPKVNLASILAIGQLWAICRNLSSLSNFSRRRLILRTDNRCRAS